MMTNPNARALIQRPATIQDWISTEVNKLNVHAARLLELYRSAYSFHLRDMSNTSLCYWIWKHRFNRLATASGVRFLPQDMLDLHRRDLLNVLALNGLHRTLAHQRFAKEVALWHPSKLCPACAVNR